MTSKSYKRSEFVVRRRRWYQQAGWKFIGRRVGRVSPTTSLDNGVSIPEMPEKLVWHQQTATDALQLIANGRQPSDEIARVALLKMGLDEQTFRRGETPAAPFVAYLAERWRV